MRLSITLDDDLHQLAAARARARQTSISREINDLLRQATTTPVTGHDHSPATTITYEGRRRFPVSQGGQPFTEDDVRRAEDEEDLRHLAPLRPTSKNP